MPEKALNIYSPTSALKGIGPAKFSALKEIGIETLFDLINYFPRKYLNGLIFEFSSLSSLKNFEFTFRLVQLDYKERKVKDDLRPPDLRETSLMDQDQPM